MSSSLTLVEYACLFFWPRYEGGHVFEVEKSRHCLLRNRLLTRVPISRDFDAQMHYDMPLTYFIFEWLGVISSRVERCHPQPAIIAVRFHVRDKCAVPNKTCERKRQAPGGNVIGEPDLTVSDRTEGMTKRINIYTSQRNNVKFSSARNDRQGENYAHTSMLVAFRTNGVF